MTQNRLSMQTPAGDWREGLPVGNGAIGAMPYGRVHRETVLLNHESLWYRGHFDRLPDISDKLPELRKLMDQKRYVEANDLYHNTLGSLGYQAKCASYHPAGDLLIEMPDCYAFQGYKRWLDLESAQTSVQWKDGDTTYRRDCFVSRINDTIVTRITASDPGKVSARLALREHDLADALKQSGERFAPPIAFDAGASDNKLHMLGRYIVENDDQTGIGRSYGTNSDRFHHDASLTTQQQSFCPSGRAYGVLSKVIHQGGDLKTDGYTITVTHSDEIIILTKLFVYEESKTAFKRLEKELDELPPDYQSLFDEHVEVHAQLYNRTRFSLDAPTHETSNESLLLQAYGGEASLELIEKMANYGRYLLICSSRPDGLPSNLQGIWNGDYAPPWCAFFMINENLQMNYWQSLPGQIPETLLGVLDFYLSYMDDFRENARKLYGCRGIFIPSLMTPDTGLITHTGSWIINWVSGAGWLAQHFYDYYLYTSDQEILKNRVFPFMLETAEFFEDFLYEDAQGKLTVCPSISPENWPDEFNDPAYKTRTSGNARVTFNATIDVAVIKELFTNLIEASELLNTHADRIPAWRDIVSKLPAYTVNEDGAAREWLHPDFSDNYHHRHQSHLYPVFPGTEVTKAEQPELHQAFKTAVDKRLVIGLKKQTGWSLSHMANINARLGDAEAAQECLDILARSCLGQNLFTYHNDYREMGITDSSLKFGQSPPFQIDANMGWTAAIYEMLLFSTVGNLHLLPALPQRWRKGSIQNLAAKGGLSVSFAWDQDAGYLNSKITASDTQTFRLTLPDGSTQEITLDAGRTICIKHSLAFTQPNNAVKLTPMP